jgi:hypothetical protein
MRSEVNTAPATLALVEVGHGRGGCFVENDGRFWNEFVGQGWGSNGDTAVARSLSLFSGLTTGSPGLTPPG